MALNEEQWQRFGEGIEVERPTIINPSHSIEQAARWDPDQAAESFRLERETSIPVEIVRNNLDEARRVQRFQKLNPKTLSERMPLTAGWLQNDRNAAVAIDDVELLGEIEKHSSERPWYDFELKDMKGWVDQFSVSAASMFDQLMLALGENTLETYRGGYLEERGFTPEQIEEKIKAQEQENARYRESARVADTLRAKSNPQDLTVMGEGIRGGITMMADMAPGLAVSFLTKGKVNPTLPYLTGKTFLDSYTTSSLEGRSHVGSTAYAGIDALIEWTTEAGPQKLASKIFGGAEKAAFKDNLKKYLLQDVAGEQVATLGQSLNAYAFRLDDQLANAETPEDALRIQGERQLVTLISTLVGSGGVSGAGYLANRGDKKRSAVLREIGVRIGSESEQAWLDRQFYLAQESQLAPRSPEAFEDYIKHVDPDTNILMDAEAAGELDGAPQYVIDQLDGSGADVVIPMTDFLRDFVVGENNRLEEVRPYIKLTETGRTQAQLEAQQASPEVEALIKRAQANEEAMSEADRVYEQVKDQLVATGRQGAATATQSAQLIKSYIVTTHERLKKRGIDTTIEQLFEDIGLTVKGPDYNPNDPQFLTSSEKTEYERAVEKGLPMDEESRKERARQQGYDVDRVWYHGTNQDFKSFNKKARGGFGGVIGEWFASSGEAASTFARGDRGGAANVLPVYLRIQSPMIYSSWDEHVSAVIESKGESIEEKYKNLKKQLKSLGYDSFLIKNSDTDGAGQRDDVAVFEPNQIRSINAAFDPDFKDSPNLLSQQDFGDIELTDTFNDGTNTQQITELAQARWDDAQSRLEMIEQLRKCANG